ncbi:RING finger protein 212B-like [Puntigrus tetrazona]|uniref:RING finger protein 212B-like n=1 Tax=Puntigrus tetrazona TaxID=1606681 RepID=UPI001C89996A|nr:RING finger protein 212B-like [Puntigrus tetrazona]
MNWFHCNNCYVREGKKFVVSSCGHIFCENCVNTSQCRVCHANCNYLHISDQMKPQEKMFFKDPVKLVQTRLEHIAQIAVFQKRQKERVISFLRSRSMELERKVKEVRDQCYRQVSELKQENEELKKPLSQRRTPPGSSISMSSMSSVHGFRTPSSVNTPTRIDYSSLLIIRRSQHTTPNNFQVQLLARPTLQSPRT